MALGNLGVALRKISEKRGSIKKMVCILKMNRSSQFGFFNLFLSLKATYNNGRLIRCYYPISCIKNYFVAIGQGIRDTLYHINTST